MRKSCCQFKIRKDINKSHPAGKCTLKHGGWEKKKIIHIEILTRPKILSASSKSLRRIATWLSSADLFMSRPNCLCMDCMACQLRAPQWREGEWGGREKCGDWDRQAGNLELGWRDGHWRRGREIQGRRKGIEREFRGRRERERERASKQASKREGMKRESWHCSKRTHFAREN